MSFTNKVLKGSVVLLISKFVLRLGGLISMIVLARLLDQKDFGLVAIASSFVFLFDILSDAGTQQYIIQKQDLNDDDLNTAWSLNIILKFISWLAFVVSIPFIIRYFESPELSSILLAISFILLISGLENPGIFLFYRDFDFSPVLKITTVEKIVSLIVVISLAFIFRSYWAMVVGVIITFSIRTLGSYYYSSFRPKFSLLNVAHQWAFSKWLLFRGGIGYARAEFDTFMVTKLFGLHFIGGYNMMKNIANIPGRDLIAPATEPLLSSFSKVKGDTEHLNYQISLSLFVVCLLSFPIACYVFFFSENLVQVLLGDKWTSFSYVLSIMSLLILTATLMSIFQNALTATSKVRTIFLYDLFSLIFVVGVLLLLSFDNMESFVLVRCLLSIITMLCMLLVCSRLFKIPALQLARTLVPAFLIAGIAGYITTLFMPVLTDNQYLLFFILPAIYFSLYLAMCATYFYPQRHTREVSHVFGILNNGYERVKNALPAGK